MNIRKPLLFLAVMASLCFSISYQTESKVLLSARQTDIQEFYSTSGVVVNDLPILDPHFAGLRVESCNKKIWYFESTSVVLPCFANMVDRIAWQNMTHTRQAYTILKSNMPISKMKYELSKHLTYDVDLNG